ncbi:MAG: 4-(cytidine 5'-diphospho)-2-C-methyl-D-erythritol kinase [Scytolyngbya sp. HA4215-MV1]|jgi:4-diphosphocytidyl-2-C-methyl-D-erythritol kinase|nr:4-(cytidine 5'-diphospho)-2-C-methyl-D-erythritol kinase [Scytolyngbya sp. HA4215-MV1]
MRSYSLLAPAKINLYLEIVGDRPDGYHELVMLLQSIDLADQVDLRSSSTDKILIHCDNPNIPSGKENLAYRAAELMTRQFPECFARYGGIEITLHKHIPAEAGLAGGSTDAAAVLVGIDLLWDLGLTQIELQDLGAMLGSDVPFCVAGGTAIATGRGEQLNPLPDLENLYVVLAKYRNLPVSTVWAYQAYRQRYYDTYLPAEADWQARRQHIHSGPMVAAIAHRDHVAIGHLLHNDLEKVVFPEFPKIAHLRDTFKHFDILGTLMSGSGSTVFALVESQTQAQQIQQQMQTAIADPTLDLWISKFTNTGIRLASTVN